MPAAAKWKVVVRKGGTTTNFIDLGEIDQWLNLSINLNFNEVSKWELTLDATSYAAQMWYEIFNHLDNGGRAGVRIYRNDDLILSGPYLNFRERVNPKEKTLIIQGADELQYIADRAHLMNPLFMTTNMTSRDHVPNKATTTDPEYFAGAIVWDAIENHLMNHTSRSISFVSQVRSNIGYNFKYANGVSGTVDYRWMIGSGENLFENIKSILDISDFNGMPVRLYGTQEGDKVVYRVETPVLKPNAILSYKLGTITEYDYSRERPTCNQLQSAATVRTSSTDTTGKRIFSHAGAEESKRYYGIIEKFEEHGGARSLEGSTTTSEAYKELAKFIQGKLKEYGEKISFQFTFQETPSVQYGHKADGQGVSYFRLGNKVPVELINASTTDIVRSVQIRVSGQQETIQPSVGPNGIIARGLRHLDRLRSLENRVTDLTVRDNTT